MNVCLFASFLAELHRYCCFDLYEKIRKEILLKLKSHLNFETPLDQHLDTKHVENPVLLIYVL